MKAEAYASAAVRAARREGYEAALVRIEREVLAGGERMAEVVAGELAKVRAPRTASRDGDAG